MMTILKNKDKKQPNNIIKKSNYVLYDKEKKNPIWIILIMESL